MLSGWRCAQERCWIRRGECGIYILCVAFTEIYQSITFWYSIEFGNNNRKRDHQEVTIARMLRRKKKKSKRKKNNNLSRFRMVRKSIGLYLSFPILECVRCV